MPDPRSLRIGDLVRFVALPDEWARAGNYVPKDSIAFMKKMIQRSFPSRVSEIEETGYPWIRARIRQRGKMYHHYWLITESSGWRRVRARTGRRPSRKR